MGKDLENIGAEDTLGGSCGNRDIEEPGLLSLELKDLEWHGPIVQNEILSKVSNDINNYNTNLSSYVFDCKTSGPRVLVFFPINSKEEALRSVAGVLKSTDYIPESVKNKDSFSSACYRPSSVIVRPFE